MKKGGLTAETVEARLRECNGNMAAVGRALGVTRQAVWDFCNRRETLKRIAEDVREGMKDDAEDILYSAVKRGEAWAVCFFLKCKAKDRGYVERQEVRHDGSATLAIVEEIVDGSPDGAGAAAPDAGGLPHE